ncbi:amino acid ABC transporter substrate-binding protein [Kamptonema sp. UHCC 0994]|uniref:amino acid ABC transporter substrate-binding protein n=1 Tax=Kamptonema sp. UHCC 0994 TaxID=3031329 RepID=UPI0023B9AD23|nr:amino acid ABC transporter substrate-binding protein [Kamptonema sp. UHCC 0994]MDF0554266.1 amino acid ABC transporter substrate-binding protein [Kamptonema sp. UHCC 0994]
MSKKLTIAGISIIFSLLFPTITLAQSTLQDVRQNGVLKVGIRKDAAPFGYTEGDNWKGICVEGMELFRASLEKQLNRSVRLEKLETVLDESSPQGRYRSITSKRIYLECGPNTINKNSPTGTAFSLPFLYSGTYLMVKPENRLRVNPSGFLQDITIGVLGDSLTQQFIAGRYQQANQKIYQGQSGRQTAVKDAVQGKIDAFASDGILLVGEALRQGLNSNQYALIPEKPLTCITYGMIVPANDSEWKETVNNFIRNQSAQNLLERTFGPNSPLIPLSVVDQDKCI